jgi:hypothetical protein
MWQHGADKFPFVKLWLTMIKPRSPKTAAVHPVRAQIVNFRQMKRIVLLFAVLLGVAQFFQPNWSSGNGAPREGIETIYAIDPRVELLLRQACYDCHSNETRVPWYARVQPLGWWIKGHIDEGREELNFSAFASYRPDDHPVIFESIMDELKHQSMPLPSYQWAHADARLTDAQRNEIILWAQRMSVSRQTP